MHYYDYQLTRNHGILWLHQVLAQLYFAFCEAECVLKISVPKTTHSAIHFLLSTQPSARSTFTFLHCCSLESSIIITIGCITQRLYRLSSEIKTATKALYHASNSQRSPLHNFQRTSQLRRPSCHDIISEYQRRRKYFSYIEKNVSYH